MLGPLMPSQRLVSWQSWWRHWDWGCLDLPTMQILSLFCPPVRTSSYPGPLQATFCHFKPLLPPKFPDNMLCTLSVPPLLHLCLNSFSDWFHHHQVSILGRELEEAAERVKLYVEKVQFWSWTLVPLSHEAVMRSKWIYALGWDLRWNLNHKDLPVEEGWWHSR